jgi:single-stranded DNA-binding protein
MLTKNRFTIKGQITRIVRRDVSIQIDVETSRFWIDGEGERQEATDCVPVTIFEEAQMRYLSENASQGDILLAEGRIETIRTEYNGENIHTPALVAVITSLCATG